MLLILIVTIKIFNFIFFRYAALEEKYKQTKAARDEAERKYGDLSDMFTHSKYQFEEQMRVQTSRIMEDERKKYDQALKAYEEKIKSAEALRNNTTEQNLKLNRDLQQNEKGSFEKLMALEKENQELKRELNEIFQNIDKLEVINEDLHRNKEELQLEVKTLRDDLLRITKNSERHQKLLEEKFEKLTHEFDLDRMKAMEDLQRGDMRNAELERLLNEKETQRVKIQSELERLQESLHQNLNKTLAQTFYDHQSLEGTGHSLSGLLSQKRIFF